jgi:hypothetical protein
VADYDLRVKRFQFHSEFPRPVPAGWRGSDHVPYASMTEARAFLDKLPVSDADPERIARGNAERFLQL